ncbi:hypothetical protein TWF694_009352 [Orbilia ellipsospora]|uniref:Betaine lipid synthase n=1 Tax=Orbilia ellipsospora TaxID=2528407 RepID=A0AAV9XG62_9PEZI
METQLLSMVFRDQFLQISLAGTAMLAVAALVIYQSLRSAKEDNGILANIKNLILFVYSCFLKPHSGDNRNQQDALESFYSTQASVYDATRTKLLSGREDMLGLVAAQLKYKRDSRSIKRKPIWVDVGGGTGYNIEKMGAYLDVPSFFETVYLVDLSPSLCKIAVERFERLGWKNVKVMCCDARYFRLETFARQPDVALPAVQTASTSRSSSRPVSPYSETEQYSADLITLSYSLSMIPDFHCAIDNMSEILSTHGIIGVADFYVQNQTEFISRNYLGGSLDRHCMWISRVFWRTWFEIDRVNLDSARRDYLEYRFGTVHNTNSRCRLLGFRIPYYIWIGCRKNSGYFDAKKATVSSILASTTSSPFIKALDLHNRNVANLNALTFNDVESKAYECAIINMSASLPLPPSWYQNHRWRVYYDDQLPKHRQFGDEYIYAFTWEDVNEDLRILNINSDDEILAITSAGDNILGYVLENPKRIHAVDLNPNQNHLLELKLAAFSALPYRDVWRLFGKGKHQNFRELLITKLAPHLSSLAFQYWMHHGPAAFDEKNGGLYHTGGSRHALILLARICKFLGLSGELDKLATASTLEDQIKLWRKGLRRILLNRVFNYAVISSEKWLWKALGVPRNQRAIIDQDFLARQQGPKPVPSSLGSGVRQYLIETLDPVIETTLLSSENPYYLLTLLSRYTRTCHPLYLTPKAHVHYSQQGAFDNLRVHTDEIAEVLNRMSDESLTIAVVMDSMDWFDPHSNDAREQIKTFHRVLKTGGRVMIRSAGIEPWYARIFESEGFTATRIGSRSETPCIDRVNMYASTWIFTKREVGA